MAVVVAVTLLLISVGVAAARGEGESWESSNSLELCSLDTLGQGFLTGEYGTRSLGTGIYFI